MDSVRSEKQRRGHCGLARLRTQVRFLGDPIPENAIRVSEDVFCAPGAKHPAAFRSIRIGLTFIPASPIWSAEEWIEVLNERNSREINLKSALLDAAGRYCGSSPEDSGRTTRLISRPKNPLSRWSRSPAPRDRRPKSPSLFSASPAHAFRPRSCGGRAAATSAPLCRDRADSALPRSACPPRTRRLLRMSSNLCRRAAPS